MPLRNRVSPFGELIADPARGLVYGNRGCLHDDAGNIRRRFVGKRWIACRLRFRGWHRSPLVQPGRFTELFFLDEATAFAAGHRPCALCRRDDYVRFAAAMRDLHPRAIDAEAIDTQLHLERIAPDTREPQHHRASFDALPDGVFVVIAEDPWLVAGDGLLRWTPGGYVASCERPLGGTAEVITPRSMVTVLERGWKPVVPFLHPSASGPQRSS